MALPVTRIISAVAPLVLGALDLYQRRHEAKGTRPENGDASLVGLQARLKELEEADLEQTRLISELSRQVEALATTVNATQEEARRQRARIRQLLWVVGGLAVLSVGLSLWVALR